ncbi:hypothetical protein [Pseudohongiella spirulinae]|uniref:Uncharacterized protein n=1 Tax=Pseudohongiella spirulinae TaxID=1249552 RepID=A0A0S2KBE0_9GAMM|nr:hypothetical protein [Pseudohongiella spirulinae]ALO45643.1 hypothetical protein PS2015_974 [Pseudohongiella spirulinae]
MRVDRQCVLSGTVEQAIAAVRTPRLFRHISTPMITFTAVDPPTFPDTWSEGTYWVKLKLFGLIPFGRQAIVISLIPSDDAFVVRDNGYSGLIKTWDHRITISQKENGVHYRDTVDIDAGILTPLIWLYAQGFYWHRQRKWQALARDGYEAIS